MDEKRVADYFVVAGLPDEPVGFEDTTTEGLHQKDESSLLPVTDVAIILRSQGETVPKGYTCIETTPNGFPADLNHGSIRSPNVYLCYRRGRDKPPLVDIGVLYEAKERVMPDSKVVSTTPDGRPANISNNSSRMFLTYRRAPENAPCNKLVVTDICIIFLNKGETPPHAFCKINKNLNRGMVGSDVYICYKKSMNRPNLLCFKPAIIGRFPLEDYDNFPLPESVPLFSLPMGATVEAWPKKAECPQPVFSTFVLTSYSAEKVYGAAVTFYESQNENKLTLAQKTELCYTSNEDRLKKRLYSIKSICLLSRWPFFDTFERFLRYLHRMSTTGPHALPLERYISHFMLDIPFPSVQRPKIWIQLADQKIYLCQPVDTPLPLSGASFIQLLSNLGADNSLYVLLYVLTEQKILFHSLRPDVLTSVAEAVVMLMFPFHWQCPYIPLCPLGLSDVLCAPLPYIVGVDSRYFDLFDPPQDVACVNLDTHTIFISDEKKWLNLKLLPKRPARALRNSLLSLGDKLRRTLAGQMQQANKTTKAEPTNPDQDFKIKMQELKIELEIQEAFLRFMAAILKDYRTYLLPITKAPTIGTTDPNSLFDYQGFLKSRDKTYSKFYMLMMRTQMFVRFIEERSFVSDKDASLAFFDECTERVDASGEVHEAGRLLDMESYQIDTTVFIAPPEPPSSHTGVEYTYRKFGKLKVELFHRHPAQSLLLSFQAHHMSPPTNSPIARRTKQEIKSAQKVAKKQAETPENWAKCLVSYCYSLWFIHLPAYTKSSSSRSKALRTAFDILVSMQKKLHPQDEICYRVLMLLCGLYSQPVLAVKVLFEMKHHGVQPNAITYGYYNKAVLESEWPSGDFHAALMWAKLRNVVLGVAQFRRSFRKRSRSVSSALEMESDQLSHASTEGSMNEESTLLTKDCGDMRKVDDHSSSGGQSDCGYASMNQDETTKAPVPAEQKLVDEEQIENSVDECSSTTTVAESKTLQRTLNLTRMDFTESDAFRSQLGSIVRSSASSLGSLTTLNDSGVNSAAGVLITSHLQDLEIGDSLTTARQIGRIRRRHKSAGEHRQKNIRLYKPHDENESERKFLRSHSFGNDAQIIHKISDEVGPAGTDVNKCATSTPAPEKPATGGNGKSNELYPLFELGKYDEESELDYDEEEDRVYLPGSFCPRPRSPNIPIKRAADQQTNEDAFKNGSVGNEEKDFLATAFSPLQDAWDYLGSGGLSKMASNLRHSFRWKNSGKNRSETGSKVARSLTFHGPAVETVGIEEFDPLIHDSEEALESQYPKKSMPRSSTLPLGPDVAMQNRNLGSLSPARFVSGSATGLSRLTAKHSEILLDSLKSAATSVASKLNEFKQSISVSGTPTKGMSISLSKPYNMDRLTSLDGSDQLSYDSRRTSMDYLSRSNRSEESYLDDANMDMLLREQLFYRPKENAVLSHVGSAPLFVENRDAHLDLVESRTLKRIAMEISMTSCSRCHACSAILYDEQIMDGWSADDSNLNTHCAFCKAKFVPVLTVVVKDLRLEGSSESLLTPAHSTESVRSAPPQELASAHHVPRKVHRKSLPCRESIDSCHENFMLFEDSSETGSLASGSNLCSPTGSPYKQAHFLGSKGSLGDDTCQLIDLEQPSNDQKELKVDSKPESLSNGDIRFSIGSSSLGLKQQSSKSSSLHFGSSLTVGEGPNVHPEPISVPYLSPLVLRKEVENVLEHEGDVSLTKPEFVDQHPIIYWNMIWYFQRINVPSHLPGLCLNAMSITRAKEIPASWQKADSRNVLINCLWDNTRLHEDMGQPLYVLWTQNVPQSSLVHALVTEDKTCSKNWMKIILTKIQFNDLMSPVKMVLSERQKMHSTRARHHSIYRDLIFLCLTALGKENIDHGSFDREYRKAYNELVTDSKQPSLLQPYDKHLSPGAILCRHYFKELELKPL